MLAGCRKHVATVANQGAMLALADTDPRQWQRTTLTFAVSDTLAQNDLRLFVRFDGAFRGRTLCLSVRTQSPDFAWVSDPVAVPAPHGNATQEGFREVVVPWRHGVVFPHPGTYTVTVTPRTAPAVRGVRAIGVMIND